MMALENPMFARPDPTIAFPATLFAGKRFAVVGLGLNGLPAAHALRAMGADIIAWDDSAAALATAATGQSELT